MKKISAVRLAGLAALGLCLGLHAELAPFPKWSEPRAITKGPHEHLFASYFAINSWSPNNRYVTVLETDLNGRLPEPNERCTLGVVDLQDTNKFIITQKAENKREGKKEVCPHRRV